MVTSTIADMIIQIKNAQAVNRERFELPASRVKENIARVLTEAGYIESFARKEGKPSDNLEIVLKYNGKQPAITHFKLISKPGLRRYVKVQHIPRPLSGHGLVIISTPMGIMSGAEAQKAGLGGEVIATVW